jgi:hypothetical protein
VKSGSLHVFCHTPLVAVQPGLTEVGLAETWGQGRLVSKVTVAVSLATWPDVSVATAVSVLSPAWSGMLAKTLSPS